MADSSNGTFHGHYKDVVPSISPSGDGVMIYDPEMVNQVNLTNPDELEAHLQVLDVRVRLRARRRRAIRLFSVAFLLVVTALLVGVGLMSSSKANGSANESDGSKSTSAHSGVTLPLPPADLASKCSLATLKTERGISICEAACEVADCCTVPEDFAMSCADAANEIVCAQYANYCAVLNNLLHDPSKTAGGAQAEVSGSDISPDELKASVDNACISSNQSLLSSSPCMSVCQDGFCCFHEGASDCPANCQAYSNCAEAYNVYQHGGNTSDASIPTTSPANTTLSKKEEIDQICGTKSETISSPDGVSCETVCSTSYCCFNHLCVPPQDLDCLEYSACYVLFADVDESTGQDNNTPDLGDDIHEACAGLLDINDAANNEACNSICSPGACCFEENLSCSNVDCSMYGDCIVLHPSFLSVSKEEVTGACQNHNDAKGQPSLCEQVCTDQVMQCCFHTGGECDEAILLRDNTVYCDVYQACKVLITEPATLQGSHKEELDAACTGGASTRSQCIQLCSSATCCYGTTIEESCTHMNSNITCSDYKACDVLYR